MQHLRRGAAPACSSARPPRSTRRRRGRLRGRRVRAARPVEPLRALEGDDRADARRHRRGRPTCACCRCGTSTRSAPTRCCAPGCSTRLPSHALGRLITAHEAGEAFTVAGTDWPTRDGSAHPRLRPRLGSRPRARRRARWGSTPRSRARARAGQPGHGQRDDGVGAGRGVPRASRRLKVEEGPRRPGDVVGSYTRSFVAQRRRSPWKAEKSVGDGVRDALAWWARLPGLLGGQPLSSSTCASCRPSDIRNTYPELAGRLVVNMTFSGLVSSFRAPGRSSAVGRHIRP